MYTDNGFKCSIEDLIPHRDRMKLVDRILELSEDRAVSSAVVTDEWPLVKSGKVDSLVLIELVAQTAGLANGLGRIKRYGNDVEKRGWLAGIKQCRLLVESIPCGKEIVTVAENRFAFGNYREVYGKTEVDSEIVGEFTLQVVGEDDG